MDRIGDKRKGELSALSSQAEDGTFHDSQALIHLAKKGSSTWPGLCVEGY